MTWSLGGLWRCVTLLSLLLAAPAAAQGLVRLETADEAIARDAVQYATRYAVPQQQAVAELRAQIASVTVTDDIARRYADRIVGIAIDHVAGLQISVLLAGDQIVPGWTAIIAGHSVPIVFRTGALATYSELVSAIGRFQADIRASLERPPGIGIDVRTGEMLVLVSPMDVRREGPEGLTTRLRALTGVPLRVELSGAPVDMMIAGGARVTGSVVPQGPRFLCTTGFAVTDGVRAGVATAAHCPDELSGVAPDGTPVVLPFVSQAGWGYQDVQINESPTSLEPRFFADTAKTLVRGVEATRSRASTRVGDWVCHRGERTGYSCAEVLMTDFAPAGDLCGGACLPTWVAVAGPTCQGGDSGAPVFAGTVAMGLVKGGTYRADRSCAMYYYMSVDYLPQGWSLMREPANSLAMPSLARALGDAVVLD